MDILEQNTNTPYRDVVIGLKKKSLTIFEAAKFLEEVISSARVNFNSNNQHYTFPCPLTLKKQLEIK